MEQTLSVAHGPIQHGLLRVQLQMGLSQVYCVEVKMLESISVVLFGLLGVIGYTHIPFLVFKEKLGVH